MRLPAHEIQRGTKLLLDYLESLRDGDPEISDLHDAFESYCMNKYSVGSSTIRVKSGGKGDYGIDFYSQNNSNYHIAQCKIPARDWLDANAATKIRRFGASAVADLRDALRYLFGDTKGKVNEEVRRLYALVESDRHKEDFSLTCFLIVFGRLNDRTKDAFDELVSEYESNRNVNLVLQEIDDLTDDFLLGSSRASDQISILLRIPKGVVLNAHDYCYFLANAADIFTAFKDFGWRLFDLNLRYEIRNSPVNGEIVNSLKYHKGRKHFHHYNNGLIIVCQGYNFRDNNSQIRVHNAQIVNGLQTAKSIYNAVSTKEVTYKELEEECKVQVKVIREDDIEFVSGVVQATNNQNPMQPRNVKANTRGQKSLRTEFASLRPRWFFQVKEGEWDSLTQEGGRFFKSVVGYPPSEFKPAPSQKRGRVIDNQEAAKSWLAFIGFSDLAGDRTIHYFARDEVYEIGFSKRPTAEHWRKLAEVVDFRSYRNEFLELEQGAASQYLLAYFLWQFVRHFIPAPRHYREEALDEGVKEGKLQKADGSITSSHKDQEDYLSTNHTYQTWRVMANMKEILVETAAMILARKYGPLDENISSQLINAFDSSGFCQTGDIREAARSAARAGDLAKDAVYSRIFGLLRYSAGQYWEDKRQQILSTSRVRTLLLRRDMITDFKSKVLETEKRKGLDRAWKSEGLTFLESLPPLEGS